MSNSNSGNNSSKLKIVNEEKYVESLNKIIQRDFFPDLPILKNQLEWMDAVETNDLERMKTVQLASLKRAASVRRSNQTPFNSNDNSFDTPQIYNSNDNSFDTPQTNNSNNSNNQISTLNNSSSNNNSNNSNEEIDNTNLDSFVNNYISEDDASYIEIQKKQNERILIKYKWLFDKAKEINKKQQQLLIENSNSNSGTNNDIKLITNSNNSNSSNTSKDQNSIIEYKPNTNSAPNTWNYSVKNQLMYIPNTNYTREIIGGAPKEIKHSNTRITEKLWEGIENKSTTQRIPTDKPFSQMTLQEQIEKLKQMEFEGKSTMEIESSMLGYISTPQIIPGGMGDESPLMTWGRVDGTPLLLDNNPISTPLDTKYSSYGTPSFKIPETPKREQLANKLVDKIVNKTPTKSIPSSPSSLSGLSPAAQKYILQKNKLSHTPASPHDQLRKSYQLTPSPVRKSNKSQTPLPNKSSTTPIKNIRQQTPKTPTTPSSKTTSTNNNNNNSTSSITDNLLDFT